MKLQTALLDGGERLFSLAGRLDAASAPALQAALEEALADGETRLLVELSAIEFLDSTGLGILVGGLKAARKAGGDLRLVSPSPPVARLLRLTTLDRVFRVLESAGAGWDS